jgi:hypothetical protein
MRQRFMKSLGSASAYLIQYAIQRKTYGLDVDSRANGTDSYVADFFLLHQVRRSSMHPLTQ